jgi:hypothetical protein
MLDAYAKKNLERLDEAYRSARKCFLQLIVFENKDAIESFKALYYNVFDLPIEELLTDISKMI